MSVSTIGYGGYQATSLTANFRQRVQTRQELAGDLQSASPEDSQGAASQIQQGLRIGTTNRTTPGAGGIDFADLAKALEAGDVAGAKKALAVILQKNAGSEQPGTARDTGSVKTEQSPDDGGETFALPSMAGSTFRVTA